MLPILLILLVDYPCVATPLRSFGPAGSAAPAPAWTPPSWRGDNFGQCIHFFSGLFRKCESRMMFDDQNAFLTMHSSMQPSRRTPSQTFLQASVQTLIYHYADDHLVREEWRFFPTASKCVPLYAVLIRRVSRFRIACAENLLLGFFRPTGCIALCGLYGVAEKM